MLLSISGAVSCWELERRGGRSRQLLPCVSRVLGHPWHLIASAISPSEEL